MLDASGLTKRYDGALALDALTLSVRPGDIYCLLGANGAGKTTTINLFLNFIEPTAGRASIDGLDVTKYPIETKRSVAYIPESVSLYGSLTGLENLRYFASLVSGETMSDARLLALFDDVGLQRDAATRRVSGYSKGMRQKVWIAVAIAKQAKALLLDEPTSGLDPYAANEFSNLLRKASENGVAVLTTTHDLFHAKHTGTRVGIMKAGRLVQSLESRDLSDVDLQALYLQHMTQ